MIVVYEARPSAAQDPVLLGEGVRFFDALG
jgi:hypothetical protein